MPFKSSQAQTKKTAARGHKPTSPCFITSMTGESLRSILGQDVPSVGGSESMSLPNPGRWTVVGHADASGCAATTTTGWSSDSGTSCIASYLVDEDGLAAEPRWKSGRRQRGAAWERILAQNRRVEVDMGPSPCSNFPRHAHQRHARQAAPPHGDPGGFELHRQHSLDPTSLRRPDLWKENVSKSSTSTTASAWRRIVITGERGTGQVCLNGPAARRVQPGDVIIVIAYGLMTPEEAKGFQPTVLFPTRPPIASHDACEKGLTTLVFFGIGVGLFGWPCKALKIPKR